MGKKEDQSTAPYALDEPTVEFTVSLFAALAHPTRLRMVELLTEREYTVNEIAAALGLLQPNASQHLAILSRASVVTAMREGNNRSYGLRGPRITQILRLVDEFRTIHGPAMQGESRIEE